tara:strand:- start:98 stop:277 length:180 start_codon:yes stop_codon:yes gene_type:complete
MLVSLTSEELTSFALLVISAVVIVGTFCVLWSERKKRSDTSDIDVDAAVRNAPYHRLDR